MKGLTISTYSVFVDSTSSDLPGKDPVSGNGKLTIYAKAWVTNCFDYNKNTKVIKFLPVRSIHGLKIIVRGLVDFV